MSFETYSFINDLSSNFDGTDFQDEIEEKVELQGNIYEGAESDGIDNFKFRFTNPLTIAERTALNQVVAAHIPKSLVSKRFRVLADNNITLTRRRLRSGILSFSHAIVRTYTLPDALANTNTFYVINDGSANCIIAKEDGKTKGRMTVTPGETASFRCIHDMLFRFS